MSHTGILNECESFLTDECGGQAFLTPSCTAALELACMMILEPGDEVIMPSWAFPSCANAVILRGGVPVFVDVDSNLNMDPTKMMAAISNKTKAIMVIHYAGVVAQMDRINIIAKSHGLYVIEDAAQALGNWKCTGDFGCVSFHYTKNIQCGQGGVLIVRNKQFIEKAEMFSRCGTDQIKFVRKQQNYYSWLDVGSQYIMSVYQAAVLKDELDRLVEITEARKSNWLLYRESFQRSNVSTPCAKLVGNGHFFWFYVDDKWKWLERMQSLVKVTSHFEALHNTIPGRKYGRASGSIVASVAADNLLVKLNTGVSEDEALMTCELVWQSAGIHNIL